MGGGGGIYSRDKDLISVTVDKHYVVLRVWSINLKKFHFNFTYYFPPKKVPRRILKKSLVLSRCRSQEGGGGGGWVPAPDPAGGSRPPPPQTPAGVWGRGPQQHFCGEAALRFGAEPQPLRPPGPLPGYGPVQFQLPNSKSIECATVQPQNVHVVNFQRVYYNCRIFKWLQAYKNRIQRSPIQTGNGNRSAVVRT